MSCLISIQARNNNNNNNNSKSFFSKNRLFGEKKCERNAASRFSFYVFKHIVVKLSALNFMRICIWCGLKCKRAESGFVLFVSLHQQISLNSIPVYISAVYNQDLNIQQCRLHFKHAYNTLSPIPVCRILIREGVSVTHPNTSKLVSALCSKNIDPYEI